MAGFLFGHRHHPLSHEVFGLSALAFLLPFVGAGLAIVSGVQLYVTGADNTDGVRHIYYIIVLVFDGLFNDGEKGIIDVSVLDGRGLEVGHISVGSAPFLRLFLRYLPVLLVTFVAHYHEWEVIGILSTGVINETVPPFFERLK